MPKDSAQTAFLIGIDPGSHSLGVGVIEFDIATMTIVSSDAWTLSGKKLAGKDDWVTDIHGERNGRVHAIENALYQIFMHFQPLSITSESPFINSKFPQAGLALTVVVCAIRQALMRFDMWKPLLMIDPPTVKMAVGAPGNAPKEVVKEKVMLLKDINYIGSVPLLELDEHSIDALAVCYCSFIRLLERINPL
jgi:Holliday junction resolvasome RuvABC endonuclease subunit